MARERSRCRSWGWGRARLSGVRSRLALFARCGPRPPDCEYGKDTEPSIPDAMGTAPRLANSGDELRLLDPAGVLTDAVVYGTGDTDSGGWLGEAVAYYTARQTLRSQRPGILSPVRSWLRPASGRYRYADRLGARESRPGPWPPRRLSRLGFGALQPARACAMATGRASIRAGADSPR